MCMMLAGPLCWSATWYVDQLLLWPHSTCRADETPSPHAAKAVDALARAREVLRSMEARRARPVPASAGQHARTATFDVSDMSAAQLREPAPRGIARNLTFESRAPVATGALAGQSAPLPARAPAAYRASQVSPGQHSPGAALSKFGSFGMGLPPAGL